MSMHLPIRISWRRMSPSSRLEAAVRDEARRLASSMPCPAFCRLVLERLAGDDGAERCHVDLLVAMPGRRVVIGRFGAPGLDQDRLPATIRETFDAARQRLDSARAAV